MEYQKRIYSYDTTLRDGAQGLGVAFSLQDKIKIARKLDDVGFDFIEGGWPGANPKDTAFFEQMQHEQLKHAKLVAFGSTRRAHITCEQDQNLRDLLAANTEYIAIVGKSSHWQVKNVLRVDRTENLAMIRDSVAYLKQHGRKVIFDAEHFFDGFKEDSNYALECIEVAAQAGADWICLCDTNGGSLPDLIEQGVKAAYSRVGDKLGIHCHDDAGLAVANSLVAVNAGARMVQGTVNGYGERCGNANILTIIANLELKMGIKVLPDNSLSKITALSHFVDDIANVHPNLALPYVGKRAFTHKGGQHVSAIMKSTHAYQHVDPSLVGNSPTVLVSELGGRSNIIYKAKELGIDIDPQTAAAVSKRVKELEMAGYTFEVAEASFELIIRRSSPGYVRPFDILSYAVSVISQPPLETVVDASVKVKVGDQIIHTAADGNGPVNALDAAIRKAVVPFFPHLEKVSLLDYRVRVLDESMGTGAAVRVVIESGDENRTWTTIGVSTNIIEASKIAVHDSLEYPILKAQQ